MSHEMEMEDFYLDARRKLAVVEEQNQLLREQNSRLTLSNDDYRAEASRLTLALDEALTLVRQYRKDAHPGMEEGHEL
jgi:hypothetical protein